jgi:hypothetical protein
MKCSNPGCNRGIGLVAYRRDWFSVADLVHQPRTHRGNALNSGTATKPKESRSQAHFVVAFVARFVVAFVVRFVVACVAFVGLITMAVLAAPPARQDASHLPGCDRNLADASAGIAAMQARIKSLSGVDSSEMCKATQLYFLEVVKARAVTALCKSGTERERDLGRFDADVAHINDAIAARCL